MVSPGNVIRVALPDSAVGQEEWQHKVRFPEGRNLHHVVDEVIGSMCKEALRRTGGAKNRAADLLGISRDSLYRYLKRMGESEDDTDDSQSSQG
jgi:DNA-binding NtrC family response regulator